MRSIHSRLVVCALALGIAATARAAGAAKPIYTLTCESTGVPFQVSLDGVVLDKADGKDSSAITAPLNLWLRAGKNPLKLRSPAGAKIAADAALHCKVEQNAPGDVVSTGSDSAGKPVAKLDWTAAKKKGPLDEVLAVPLAEKDAPACELWKRAEKLTLDAPTRAAILKQVQELEAAFRARDPKRVLALQRFVGEDFCRCYGRDVEEFRRSAPEQLSAMLGQLTKPQFQPWDPAKATVELVAGDRVAQVSVNGDAPIVIVQDDGTGKSTMKFQPFVARIDGALVIVR